MALTWVKIGNLKGPKGNLGTWLQGLLPDGSDLNAVTGLSQVGLWYVANTASALTMTNLPPGVVTGPGTLVVERGPASYGYTAQTYTVMGTSPQKWWRQMLTGSTWSVWKRLDNGSTVLPDGTDLNTLAGYNNVGSYYIPNDVSAASLVNKPAGAANKVSYLVVRSGPASGMSYTEQVYTVMQTTPSKWWRTLTAVGTWSEWERVDGAGYFALDSGHYGTPNVARIEEFKARHPVTSTSGKGAVMFRFDHGLTYLKSTIIPMLNSGGRNWKCLIAMNSRNWAKAENSGMSQAEATALIDAGHEFGNHTADGNATGTHKDMDTKAALWDGIVVGKQELEAQLGRPVEHFIMPGTVNGMGGLGTGASLDAFCGTYGGSLALTFHAVVSGSIPNTRFRVLDGRLKQAQQHYTIEDQTVTAIKAQIDIAASTKTALQLMLHPRNIDQPGYLTLAGLTDVFAYIDTKVAAGQLVVLGTSESLMATTDPVGTELIR
ncbi:hypothetical protein ACIPWF_00830 [Paenarthrobacter sp. NPDC089989]|uniref:hypothetical protein n=1 Tax=unclassified Paenarthrobacter TaxID=2634190 RepID=UPI0037FA971E